MPPVAIAAGVMAAGAIAKGRQQRKTAKKQQEAAKKTRQASLKYASPENYLNLLNQYRTAFQQGYKPALNDIGQNLALGEQASNQDLQATLGRRGLSGSGIGMALQNANAATRTSNYNQAVRDFYTQAEQSARGQADVTAGRQTGTSNYNPYTYMPRPGWGEIAGDAASAFAGAYGQGQASGLKSYWGQQQGPG